MATITSLGVGSGLDLETLVTSLMQVEKRPLTALQTQSKGYSTKISALGTLSSKLSSLQTAVQGLRPSLLQSPLDKFASFSATVADSTIASATASTGAVAGSYSLEVTKLAQSQRLLSPAFGASDTFGTGTLKIEFGTKPDADTAFDADTTKTATIAINSGNNTLTGIRNAINTANIGVSATIVNGTSGSQLILTGQDGSNQVFKVSGISGLEYDPDGVGATDFALKQSAQDAEFILNGVSAKSSSNTVTGALDGVTLKLAKSNTGSPTTLNIAQDNSTNLKSALDAFIKAYNDAASTMKSQGAYNAETKAAGALQGQSILRSTQSQVRDLVFTTTVGGSSQYQRLVDIGIATGADGGLTLDSKKLDAALAKDPGAVAAVVAKVGKAFDTTLSGIVGVTGSIQVTTDSMNAMVRDINKRQDALQLRLDTIEARYRKQFSALDTLMSNMNKTSTYLTQQLKSLASS